MAAVTLDSSDLAPFADIAEDKASVMIEDVLALAARVAPCITEEEFEHEGAARAILRGVILRWNEQGVSGVTSRSVARGPFTESETYDARQQRRTAFWPSEIAELQDLCQSEDGSRGAFEIDPTAGISIHAGMCSLYFGADYCSCGADLTGLFPLYGG